MNDDKINEGAGGMDRRTVLKRSAVVGGALVWATPVVQSIASPAFAATSPVVVGCITQKRVAVKFDGKQEPINANQCIPAGTAPGTQEGLLIGPAIINNDPVTGIDTLTFTLGVNDTFISICAIGGNVLLSLTLVSTTKNANGTTTIVFLSNAGQSDISNFSVLFGDCP